MIAYVLTRTAGRPRMFARARESLLEQTHAPIVHVVHAEPDATYAEGDHIITGRPERNRGPEPYNLYINTLAEYVKGLEPGWVTILDDDDEYTSPRSLETMMSLCTDPNVMPIWRVLRENGRLSPQEWQGNLAIPRSAVCFEGAAHHTSHLGKVTIDARPWADGRYWLALSKFLRVTWHNEALTRAQAGKGKGRRRDYG